VSETNETIVAAKPLASAATMFTRENLTVLFKCSHGELGRLLSRKMAPLPVRIDGQILWHVDEVQNASAQVLRTLERWKTRR
jgi:hypothetical protein